MIFRPEMWSLIISAVIIMALMGATWKRRNIPSGRAFLLLMLCSFVWAIAFVLEIGAQSLHLKLLLVKIRFSAIAFMPVAWIYLVMHYTGKTKKRLYWAVLCVIPLLTNLIIWFLPLSNIFWSEPRLMMNPGLLPVMNHDYGVWFYYIHAPFSYGLMGAAIIILVKTYYQTHSIYRFQIGLMLVAAILPLAADIACAFGLSPVYTSAVPGISCLVIAYTLFKYSFLDLLPMVRDEVLENMDDGVIVLDTKSRIVDANPAAKQITGITPDDIGWPIGYVCPYLVTGIHEEISRMHKQQIEIPWGLSGEIRVYELRLSDIKDHLGRMMGKVITLRDYTDRAALFKRIQAQAIHDHLTGVFNRRHFIECGEKEISLLNRHPGNHLAVIMIDIDKFKNINDKYGHAVGDQVLMRFSEHCQKSMRPYDIMGRLGGDEFAILLPNTSLNEAKIVAQRIHQEIQRITITAEDKEAIEINACLGVVSSECFSPDEVKLENLLKLADEVMYLCKKSGRNRVLVYEKGMELSEPS